MMNPPYAQGTGRRKTAIARVRMMPGEGEIVVNGRTIEEHFGNAMARASPAALPGDGHRRPLQRDVKGQGGGVTGQAGAIQHGIARALVNLIRRLTASRSASPACSPATRG